MITQMTGNDVIWSTGRQAGAALAAEQVPGADAELWLVAAPAVTCEWAEPTRSRRRQQRPDIGATCRSRPLQSALITSSSERRSTSLYHCRQCFRIVLKPRPRGAEATPSFLCDARSLQPKVAKTQYDRCELSAV